MACTAIALMSACVVGCEAYRVEYHTRPDFYYDASETELKDEWVAPDGTVVKFSKNLLPSEEAALAKQLEAKELAARERAPRVDRDGDGEPDPPKPTPLWEEHDDGTVTMRAFLPQHVVSNLMQTLREERYGEFYDQLVCGATQQEFAAHGKGNGTLAFSRWCAQNRRSLMETLNRISFGYMKSDVLLRKIGQSTYRIDFTPRLAQQFKYTSIDVEYEGVNVKFVRVGTKGGKVATPKGTGPLAK